VNQLDLLYILYFIYFIYFIFYMFYKNSVNPASGFACCCFQASVKQGAGQDDRLVLLIRVINPLMGLPGMLSAVIACEAEGTGIDNNPSIRQAGLSEEGDGVEPNDARAATSDGAGNTKNKAKQAGPQSRSKAAAELAMSPDDSEVRHQHGGAMA
jgi:hypothetical protein